MLSQTELFPVFDEPVSKYTVKETLHGFAVSASNRNPVTIVLHPTYLEVGFLEPKLEPAIPEILRQENDNTRQKTIKFNFFDYYNFSAAIASGLMAFWERPKREGEEYEPPWLRPWVTKQTAKAIGKRVHEQWKRLLTKVDPNILATHRAVFVANGMKPKSDFIFHPAIYDHKYISDDIQRYRACAILAGYDLTSLFLPYISQFLPNNTDAAAHWIMEQRIQKEVIKRIPETLLHNWDKWPVLFSDTGEIYTSLTRTLFNLPGCISPGYLKNLRDCHLERPIIDRLELTLILTLAECFKRSEHHSRIFQHATKQHIKTAMQRVSNHLHEPLNSNRTRDIQRFAFFVTDYPEYHTGNLVGLADKAIVWHREEQEKEKQELLAKYEGSTRLASPPVTLPNLSEIKFIATIDDLCQEAVEMQHCIASYAERAIEGDCYLFHIEHNNDLATVQVAPDGQIVQAHGLRNGKNNAVRWGKCQLRRWGKSIPENAQPLLYEPKLKPKETSLIDIATRLGPLFEGLNFQIEAEPEIF